MLLRKGTHRIHRWLVLLRGAPELAIRVQQGLKLINPVLIQQLRCQTQCLLAIAKGTSKCWCSVTRDQPLGFCILRSREADWFELGVRRLSCYGLTFRCSRYWIKKRSSSIEEPSKPSKEEEEPSCPGSILSTGIAENPRRSSDSWRSSLMGSGTAENDRLDKETRAYCLGLQPQEKPACTARASPRI